MRLAADYEKIYRGTAAPVLDVDVSRHTQRRSTAAPVLDVDASGSSVKIIPCKGIIDTGAAITMIPPSVVKALDLQTVGKTEIRGVSGTFDSHEYLINMTINGTVFEGIRAAEYKMEMEMLIGRNVINLWDLHLCGRTRKFVLEPWSTSAQDAWDDN